MPIPRSPRRLLVLGAAIAYWLLLFYVTHRPITPGGGPPRLPHFDKLQHAVAFAALGTLVCAAAACFVAPSWRLYAGVIAMIALYGALDEWSQGLIPHRTADVLDWAVDVIGATLGVMAFAVASRWCRRG